MVAAVYDIYRLHFWNLGLPTFHDWDPQRYLTILEIIKFCLTGHLTNPLVNTGRWSGCKADLLGIYASPFGWFAGIYCLKG